MEGERERVCECVPACQSLLQSWSETVNKWRFLFLLWTALIEFLGHHTSGSFNFSPWFQRTQMEHYLWNGATCSTCCISRVHHTHTRQDLCPLISHNDDPSQDFGHHIYCSFCNSYSYQTVTSWFSVLLVFLWLTFYSVFPPCVYPLSATYSLWVQCASEFRDLIG